MDGIDQRMRITVLGVAKLDVVRQRLRPRGGNVPPMAQVIGRVEQPVRGQSGTEATQDIMRERVHARRDIRSLRQVMRPVEQCMRRHVSRAIPGQGIARGHHRPDAGQVE